MWIRLSLCIEFRLAGPASLRGFFMLINQAPTACDSFHVHHAIGSAKYQQAEILGFFEARGGDWSIGEVAEFLGLQKSTVSARIYELMHQSPPALVAAPKRKDGFSGVTVRPVCLPQKQMRLF